MTTTIVSCKAVLEGRGFKPIFFDDDGKVQWLTDQPNLKKARILVTILEETEPCLKRRSIPDSIAGKGKTLGDIVAPIIDEQDWECLR